MTRYLSLTEVLELHRQVIKQSGGTVGLHDLGVLESAIVQPRMTFGGIDLYPTIVEKSSALGFSLVKNHPFLDGNKRTGQAAMEVFLVLNGLEINASVEEQEIVTVVLQPVLNRKLGNYLGQYNVVLPQFLPQSYLKSPNLLFADQLRLALEAL